MSWKFGQYLEELLEAKGGRKAGWHPTRLAEKADLSVPYVRWLIHGEASGKKGSPTISVDTLIALSKALNEPEKNLLAAYKGQSPDEASNDNSKQILDAIIQVLLQNVPHKVFAEALLAVDGPEKVQQLMAEAKRRYSEKQSGQTPEGS